MAKIIGNTTATPNPRPDWEQTDETKADYIKNKPDLIGVSTLEGGEIFNDYDNSEATGEMSHAEGFSTRALEIAAHVEGNSSIASGRYSHAENDQCTASGHRSHAGGFVSTSNGQTDFVQGYNLISSGESFPASTDSLVGQCVVGMSNEVDSDALFIVGNGTFDTNWGSNVSRSNAFVVKQDGSAALKNQGTTDNSVVIKQTLDSAVTSLDNVLKDILAAIQSDQSNAETIDEIERTIVSYLETKTVAEVE